MIDMDNIMTNHVSLDFDAISENEAFARMAVALFMAELNPTLGQIDDVKTAVSEAVTNAIIHGYERCTEDEKMDEHKLCGQETTIPQVHMECSYTDRCLTVTITDDGVGIKDVKKALEPLYTSKPELERSGMGFSFMEAFMDELSVTSTLGQGTCVRMKKML